MKGRVFVCLLVLLTGCSFDDKKAMLSGPFNPLPPGATATVLFGDSCGGRVPGCKSESVDELLLFESDHPNVVELVDADTLLPTSSIQPQMAIHALAVGDATVRARGKFSDGTEREATLGVSVRKITKVRLDTVCQGDKSGPFYMTCGSKVDFQVFMYSGDQPMQGHLPTLLSGADLSILPEGDLNYYEWNPTSCPEQVTVSSDFNSTMKAVFSTFGATDVSAIHFDYPFDLPTRLYGPDTIRVGVASYVSGHLTCDGVAPVVRAFTPEVCTGAAGQLQWTAGNDIEVAVLREGTCTLTVETPGGVLLAPFTVDAFIVRAPQDELMVSMGDRCYTEGQAVCDVYRTATLVCSNGHWARTTVCATKQICDYVPVGGPGCSSAADCPACRNLTNP